VVSCVYFVNAAVWPCYSFCDIMLDEASAAVLTVEPYLLWLMLLAGCVSDLLLTTMFLAFLFHSSLLAAL
jgi:hypothetical protein